MPYEDFTTYVEVDAEADITVAALTVTVNTIRLIAGPSYVKKDFGASYFGDFTHDVAIDFVAAATDPCYQLPWAMTNGSLSYTEMNTNTEGLGIMLYFDDPGYRIGLMDRDAAVSDKYDPATLGKKYYTIARSGTAITADIYSDALHTTPVDNLAITGTALAYRHMFGFMSYDNAGGNGTITCVTENLDLSAGTPDTTTFLGTVDNSYADASNWQGSKKPGAGDHVVISADCTLDEVIAGVVFGSLTIDAARTYNIGNYTVDYGGNITIPGILVVTATGTLKGGANWNASGTLTLTAGATIELYGDGTFTDAGAAARNHKNLKIAAAGKSTLFGSAYPKIAGLLTLGGGALGLSGAVGRRIDLVGVGTVLAGTWSSWLVDLVYETDTADGAVEVEGGTFGADVTVGQSTTGVNHNEWYTLQGNLVCVNFVARHMKFGANGCEFNTVGYNISTSGNCDLGCTNCRRLKVFLQGTTLDVAGNLSVLASAGNEVYIYLQQATIEVEGNVTVDGVNSQTFELASTLTLDGAAGQVIDLGDQPFGHLNVTNTSLIQMDGGVTLRKLTVPAGGEIDFKDGKTFNVDELALSGASGNPLTLRSQASGSSWALNVFSSVDLGYIDVSDCDAESGEGMLLIDPIATDSGGNLGWVF